MRARPRRTRRRFNRPKRRRAFRRRRFTRRTRGRKPLNSRIYTVRFNQASELQTTDGTTGNLNAGIGIQLNSCLGYDKWASQFDQYRIKKWIITWRPIYTESTVGTSSDIGWFYSYPDHDDLSAAPSIDAARSRTKYRETKGNRIHKRVINPSVLTPKYRTAGTSLTFATGPTWGQWIDSRDYDVLHYGIKFGAKTSTPSRPLGFEVHGTVYVQFKNRLNGGNALIENHPAIDEELPTDQEG